MKKNSAKIVGVVLGILFIIIAIAAQNHVLARGQEVLGSLASVASIINIFALAFAGLYVASGSTKSSAMAYKAFLALFTFASLFTAVDLIVMITGGREMAIFKIIVYGLLNVLLFAKDLGRKKSFTIAYSVLGVTVLLLAATIAKTLMYTANATVELPAADYIKISFLRWFSHFMLSVVLVYSVHMKYYDKKSRNTN